MYARMLVRQQPMQFQVDCGASANILPLRYAEGEELDSCSQMLVMWNGTKVTPVGSCALPVVNPKTNEKYKVSSRERGFDPFAWLKFNAENEAVNCTQGKFH